MVLEEISLTRLKMSLTRSKTSLMRLKVEFFLEAFYNVANGIIFVSHLSFTVERLPSDIFMTLANKLTYDYLNVAHLLSIEEQELSYLNTTYERTFQMLSKWRKANPNKVWRDLKNVLLSVKRMDLVIECERSMLLNY